MKWPNFPGPFWTSSASLWKRARSGSAPRAAEPASRARSPWWPRPIPVPAAGMATADMAAVAPKARDGATGNDSPGPCWIASICNSGSNGRARTAYGPRSAGGKLPDPVAHGPPQAGLKQLSNACDNATQEDAATDNSPPANLGIAVDFILKGFGSGNRSSNDVPSQPEVVCNCCGWHEPSPILIRWTQCLTTPLLRPVASAARICKCPRDHTDPIALIESHWPEGLPHSAAASRYT